MKSKKLFFVRDILLLAAIFVIVLATTAGAQVLSTTGTSTQALPGSSGIVPGEVLVGFASSASLDQMNAVVAILGGTAAKKIILPQVKIWKVKLSSATQAATDEAVSSLMTLKQADPSSHILFVEPNIIQQAQQLKSGGDVSIESQTNDSMLSYQWGYYDIGENWLPAPTTAAPMIAVIDTGVDYTNPDLLGKVVLGYDYVNADTNPMDDNMHGTHVSGIAAAKANNGYGITGVSWTSKILAVKVLNAQGSGSVFDVALGIIAAANNASVKVINMSLGGGYSSTEQSAVDYAVNTKGKLLVAAAGNNNSNVAIYPAGLSVSYPNKVLAVAAHDSNDCKASFSNYGTYVSISAPGVVILSDLPLSINSLGVGYLSGTSMATPFVSGAAAVAWSKFPAFTNAQIGALLTTDTSLYNTLLRDGTCWPNDGTSFQKLSLFHVIDAAPYVGGTISGIWGFAEDAESGGPLAGAKVTTKQGLTVTGTDYVPYYGYADRVDTSTGTYQQGYGLFNVLPSTVNVNQNLSLSLTGYATPVISNIFDTSGLFVEATLNGQIPVPPVKPFYWLVVTWDYGSTYTVASYDSYLNIPGNGSIGYVFGAGDLNALPFAEWLWDNDNEANVTLRQSSETIRIKKVLPGTYTYEINDFWNGAGSTAWGTSGITAYVYKWNPLTLKPVLVNTIIPPVGAGQFWHVLSITGNTVTVNNTLNDSF
jgi:thermitase